MTKAKTKNIGVDEAVHRSLTNEARMQGRPIYKFANDLLKDAVKRARASRLNKGKAL